MRSSFYKEKYKPVEDAPTETVSLSCRRQISSKCETMWLWQLLRDLLQSALRFILCGGAQVHKPEASAGSPAAGTSMVARVAPTHAHGQEIQVSQHSLYSKLVCLIVHVCELEVGAEGVSDTKLCFSELFTYKGTKNQYLLKSGEMSCCSVGYIRGVSFCSGDLYMWLELRLLPEPILW